MPLRYWIVCAAASAAALFFGLLFGTACAPDPSPPAGDHPAARAEMPPEAAGGPAPRIVLLLSLDTLRADHLGVYGYERFTSPVIDTLAREGVVFEDASSTASWTLPSHASILTGLNPFTHGVLSSRTVLPENVPTLASILKEAGWQTAAVVNVEWLKKENYHLTRDFDHYLWAPSTLSRRSPSTWVTDQAIEWLTELGDEPLLLFAHYYDVHSDYVSDPAYEKLFVTPYDGPVDGTGWQLKQASLPDDYIAFCQESFDPERCKFADEFVVDDSVVKLDFDEDDLRHLVQLYDAQIRQLDAELGRLFAALRRLDLMDETLLIVTSDHGEEFREHGRFEHFLTAYQESVRVPLIVRGPGVPAGLRIQAPVSGIDIVPTVLSRVGVEAPEGIEGLDLSPLWSGGSPEPFAERPLFVEAAGGVSHNYFAGDFYPIYRSVRKGRYKLVVEAQSGRHALYDLETDPGEQLDIAEREPEIAAALLAIGELRYQPGGRGARQGSAPDLDPEDLERLRALGYVP